MLSAGPPRNRPNPREHSWRPPAEGLYDLSLEKILALGFIANIKARKSHQIVSDALNILCTSSIAAPSRRSARRRRAGILVQSARLLRAQDRGAWLHAAAARRLPVGALFIRGEGVAQSHRQHHRRPDQGRATDAARLARRANRQFLARRNRQADRACPYSDVHRPRRAYQERRGFERRLYILRKSISQAIYQRPTAACRLLSVSMSCRTVVYKACSSRPAPKYYPDLSEPIRQRAGVVHQRFSTNTFPTGRWRIRTG